MEQSDFEQILKIQENHWWFKGRRKILSNIMSTFLPARQENEHISILEIGSGTGSNLKMLSGFGQTQGLEPSDYARKVAGWNVLKGWLPDGLDAINGQKYDLICMFDVLEHVEHEGESLAILRNYLKPGAALFLTVPAYQWMFNDYDRAAKHYRRYTRKRLCNVLHEYGYKVLYSGYFNSFLFPLMALARLWDTISCKSGHSSTGISMPSNFINACFYSAIASEAWLIPKISMPFGGSVTAFCRII